MIHPLHHLKYDTGNAFTDINAMVDELAATPPGHERAGQLSQQIKSRLDGVSTAIDGVQPDAGPAQTVTGVPVPQNDGAGQMEAEPHLADRVASLEERFEELRDHIEDRFSRVERAPTAVHDHAYADFTDHGPAGGEQKLATAGDEPVKVTPEPTPKKAD